MTQPNWTHFVRLATSDEIAELQRDQGLDLSRVAPGHFVYALHRLGDPQKLFVVLPPQGELDADACRQAWHDAADKIITGQIKGQAP
jgi:hypothetical protein